MLKLKKKDTVLVIAGRDKGKKGEIKEVRPETHKVVVMGVNIVMPMPLTSSDRPLP